MPRESVSCEFATALTEDEASWVRRDLANSCHLFPASVEDDVEGSSLRVEINTIPFVADLALKELSSFLQGFLAVHRPDQRLVVHYSEKILRDYNPIFSGGAICITAQHIYEHSARKWAEEQWGSAAKPVPKEESHAACPRSLPGLVRADG